MRPAIKWIGHLHQRHVHSRRAQVLVRHFAELIPAGATVLDVGCGDGMVDSLILKERPDITISGIDVQVQPRALIPVERFDGSTIPRADRGADVVMFMDVLHHTVDPMALLLEGRRVARKCVLVKDHNRDGFLAGPILRLMDWVSNAPRDIALPFNYWSRQRWCEAFDQLNLNARDYRSHLALYPWPARWVFERSLHFVARLDIE